MGRIESLAGHDPLAFAWRGSGVQGIPWSTNWFFRPTGRWTVAHNLTTYATAHRPAARECDANSSDGHPFLARIYVASNIDTRLVLTQQIPRPGSQWP